MKIPILKGYSLTEQERYEVARLLAKMGHRVYVGKEKPEGKSSGYVHFIEISRPSEKEKS